MAQYVIFSGETKRIIIKPGVTELDVQVDLYSDWKEWVLQDDNAKWEAAFRTFGGDETSESQFAPRYFFLINGWKLYAEDVDVVIQTNLYSDDGLAPVERVNAQILIRNSDVPVVQSELEQRLDYGDRVYYDETSVYTGTTYPNGTIAQPVNNPLDAVLIAYQYNINDIYALSDITMPGISGQTFDGWEIYADKPNLTFIPDSANTYQNMLFNGFTMNTTLSGGTNIIENCIIDTVTCFDGEIKFSQMLNYLGVCGNAVLNSCYSGIAGAGSPIFDLTAGLDTTLSVRAYSGGVDLRNSDTSNSRTTVELIAGQVILNSSCTDGYIDLRGVGYITDNSSGSTINKTGFVDSFETYVEQTRETDEILAYNNKIFVDAISGSTGTTFPIGTVAQPVNNFLDLFTISNTLNIKNIYSRSDLLVSGLTFTADDFSIFSDTPKLNLYVYSGDRLENTSVHGFYIQYADFYGVSHTFYDCTLKNIFNLAGDIHNCGLDGRDGAEINVFSNTNLISCYPEYSGQPVTLNLVNPSGALCSVRDWNGDLIVGDMNHADDRLTLDVSAGKIEITSGVTSGTIDLRGVGYLENNAGTGATVITTGFVDSFQTYIEETQELDQQLAYGNKLFIDTVSGVTGITYPVGTVAQPVNNVYHLFYLSNELNIKNIYVREILTLNNFGFTADNFNAYSDTPYVPLYVYNGDEIVNVAVYGFDIIYADFYGQEHFFDRCILRQIDNLAGHLVECDLDGGRDPNDPTSGTSINVYGNTTFVRCHPLHAGDPPTINLINPSGTTCAFRNWNGDLIVGDMNHADDRLIIETSGSKITISSGCTAGLIDIRGVCYVENNALTGCTVQRDGQLQASPSEYNGQIVIDTVNGKAGTLFPVGTNYQPVNNFTDALTLLNNYQLEKVYIIGALSITGGEDISGIAFTAERSTGNYLTITSAVTNFTYVENLTCINIVQNGSMRYTTSVLVNIDNFDGGAKDCLIVDSNINIVGAGSNYFTNCDRYVTDPTAFTTFDVADKKLNMIRCRGNFIIDNKTSSNTIAVDLTAGFMRVGSGCTNGIVAINGITEVEDYSQSGCSVLLKAISNPSITDHVWDEQISEHLQVGSTGYKLNLASSGGVDYDALASAVWDKNMSGYTSSGGTLAGDMLYTVNETIVQITGLTTLNSSIERILGLSQQNYRLSNQIYDTNNCLLSATIKIYPTATDCDNDTNEIAEYGMSATYTTTGQMLDYKVIEV